MGIDTRTYHTAFAFRLERGNEEKPEWALTPPTTKIATTIVMKVEMKRSPNGH